MEVASNQQEVQFPSLMGRGLFQEYVHRMAYHHGVTPYALLLHMLSLHRWSAKQVARHYNASHMAVMTVMQKLRVKLPGGQGGTLSLHATDAGLYDPIEYGLQMIRQYGNYVRAARVLGISKMQFYLPFAARRVSFDNVQHIQLDGDTALYSARGVCRLIGISYQAVQKQFYYAQDCGEGYAGLQDYLVRWLNEFGYNAKTVRVLGWPMDKAFALLELGRKKVDAIELADRENTA